MRKRSYDQYCPVAHALDLVGERWAMLVVKELMHGPQRYTDLAEALPKIGSPLPRDTRSPKKIASALT